MENEGADFFHLLLAQKVVYEEDALKFLNTLLSKGNKRRVRNSDELLERLAGHNRSVSKFGFEVNLLNDPLGRTPGRSGVFYTVVNTEKDDPVQAALALPVRKEALFFHTIIRHLLYECDDDEEEESPSTVIGRILPISMLRNPQFLRSIAPDEPPLLLRDVERILVQLDREKWIKMTKMGGNPGQLEDPRPRGVWFGARAIAEFPRISQELRRRQIGGPRRKKSSSSEQILREKEVYAGETEKATIPHFPSSLVTPVGSQQRPFDRVSSPRSRSRAVGFNSGGISSVLDERPEYSGSVVESMATPFAAPNTNIRRGEKRRFEPSSEELSRDEDPVDIPRVRKKSRLLMRHFPT